MFSLIFPTYNPGRLLERTCQYVQSFLRQASDDWEVLFVCDGCTDGTPERLAQWVRASSDPIRVLQYAPNRGKGYAVRHGLAAARGGWRLFTDVDLAYSLDDVVRVAQVLRAGADVAIASRTHPQSRLVLPVWLQGYAYRRHLQSMAFSLLVRLLLPLTQGDTQAGLKGLSAHATQLVLPLLRCDGFGFDCELLTASVHHRLAIAEVPICVSYEDTASTIGWRRMSGMVGDLWRIRQAWRHVWSSAGEPSAPPNRRQAA